MTEIKVEITKSSLLSAPGRHSHAPIDAADYARYLLNSALHDAVMGAFQMMREANTERVEQNRAEERITELQGKRSEGGLLVSQEDEFSHLNLGRFVSHVARLERPLYPQSGQDLSVTSITNTPV